MKLASVVPNNVVRTPIRLDLGFTSTSPFQSTACTRWIRVRLTSCSYTSYPGVANRGWRCFPSVIARSGKTEQDESSYTSEEEIVSFPLHAGSDDMNKPLVDSSVGEPQGGKQEDNYVSSVKTVALCVSAAVAFGVGLGLKDGAVKASEFFAGYLLEQSLSVDNLFVFVLIFKYFKVPLMYQNRVLSYGIAGAIFFRLSLILLGTATIQRFEAVNLLLAAILLYSSFKLFANEEEESDLSDNFIVKTCQKFIAVTPNYDGNRFITVQDGIKKASNVLGRLLLCC